MHTNLLYKPDWKTVMRTGMESSSPRIVDEGIGRGIARGGRIRTGSAVSRCDRRLPVITVPPRRRRPALFAKLVAAINLLRLGRGGSTNREIRAKLTRASLTDGQIHGPSHGRPGLHEPEMLSLKKSMEPEENRTGTWTEPGRFGPEGGLKSAPGSSENVRFGRKY